MYVVATQSISDTKSNFPPLPGRSEVCTCSTDKPTAKSDSEMEANRPGLMKTRDVLLARHSFHAVFNPTKLLNYCFLSGSLGIEFR